ncbi:hypothetical protein [Paenibacillus sp. FSL M7-0420]|uniref:hypothetical protein n=1 Tax=Paenibacillus sp. FSL M7-0420 TaxID=2921609 RepID=UPI0030FB01B8
MISRAGELQTTSGTCNYATPATGAPRATAAFTPDPRPFFPSTLCVIGFSITFRPHGTIRRNVIGFSITFGPDTSTRRNVIGFSITFAPRTYPNNAKTAHSTI